MKPVVIVGNVIRARFPWTKSVDEVDYWSWNEGATRKQKLTAAFQIHDAPRYECKGEKYMEWLRNAPVPVYMRERHDEFPTSIAYPFEEVFDLTKNIKVGQYPHDPLKYLTSTVAFAVALAVLQNRPAIEIYGVELTVGKDYKLQREGFAFWVGFAGQKGIPVDIYGCEAVFKKPLYGLGLED